MKLWEAILIGCDRRAQAFGSLFKFEKDGTCTSCAFGAAYEAVFNDISLNRRIESVFPFAFEIIKLLEVGYSCPIPGCDVVFSRLANVIVHLNDDHKWPREKIALEFVKPYEEELYGEEADSGRVID